MNNANPPETIGVGTRVAMFDYSGSAYGTVSRMTPARIFVKPDGRDYERAFHKKTLIEVGKSWTPHLRDVKDVETAYAFTREKLDQAINQLDHIRRNWVLKVRAANDNKSDRATADQVTELLDMLDAQQGKIKRRLMAYRNAEAAYLAWREAQK